MLPQQRLAAVHREFLYSVAHDSHRVAPVGSLAAGFSGRCPRRSAGHAVDRPRSLAVQSILLVVSLPVLAIGILMTISLLGSLNADEIG